MGCAMQQEDGQSVEGPKKCENNDIVLPPLPIKKKALKNCAGANENDNEKNSTNNYLKQTHSVLVKILESAPILINNSNNSKANNCDTNDKKQCDETDNSGKECPKIELCPWKKTKLIVNNSCNSNDNSSNMISQNVCKCECDQLVNSDSEEEDMFEHLSKKRKSSMTEWRHNSTDSSESSTTSLSASSPPSYTDSGCDDSDHSENCGLNDLCQQFHENLNNNNTNNNDVMFKKL